jgi:hypothetical protein
MIFVKLKSKRLWTGSYNRPNIEQVEQLVRDTSATGLVALYWKATARHTVERELDWDGDLSVNTDVIEERLHSLYQNTHGYKETYEHLKDEVQTLSRTMIVSPGGVDHSWREGVVSEAVMPYKKIDQDPDDIIDELRERGIEILDIKPDDIKKLSKDDIQRLEDSRLHLRCFDKSHACWYPLIVDKELEEIGRKISLSGEKWRKPTSDS